jgi:CRP/FNR family cyclic AMP-dependent transcriptional regulator
MQSHYEKILLLKKVPFFELLRTDQLHRIVSILEPIGWAKGDRVFEKDEPADNMYLIVSGHIGISLDGDPDNIVARLGHGDFFGEMGILDDLARSATAHVLAHTEALMLEKEKLLGLLRAYPEFGIGMLKALSRRVRAINDDLQVIRGSSQPS